MHVVAAIPRAQAQACDGNLLGLRAWPWRRLQLLEQWRGHVGVELGCAKYGGVHE